MNNNLMIVYNIGELITSTDPWLIKDAAIVINEKTGLIKEIGKNKIIKEKYNLTNNNSIDAKGASVLPGFIDSHTHFVFGGYRADEYLWRLEGQSYSEIMEKGGGIVNTVDATRQTSFDELLNAGKKRLDNYLQQGVTTIEGKSGYGLNIETEIKQLDVMRSLNCKHPIDVVQTFMGAHSVSREFNDNKEGFVNYVIEEMLPIVAKREDVSFCDVFCDKGVFTTEETKMILQEAKSLGLKPKLHVDEIAYVGGAELAAELNAVSAEHLLKVSDEGITRMAENNVIPVILPITAFSLQEKYAPARKMLDNGLNVAVSTDFNPGSSHSYSIPLLLSLSAIKLNMNLKEIVKAVTINAAKALDRDKLIGSLEPGKYADLIILDAPSYEHLIYNIGGNIVDTVIKKGSIAHKKDKLYYEKNNIIKGDK
ncbi:imidazolonepropionase [Halanaerobiaceae bacterium Z-7014]|uniref:Imidazolonepropionase n=1 Tax=Halonatronomonas betaini TaxID=2778430 RepID=A0A931F7G0_9FIRM|nr:imidazolonepropionase [Halonatronomonas betaini]MBF8436631.1 imidazolonepropionase [Halonatronomonas betaini]